MVERMLDVKELPKLLNADFERIEIAKTRQKAVWEGEKPDAWPIILSAPLNAEQQAIPDPNLKEAFYDADLMLCSQVRGACAGFNSRSDAVPSIRANLGTASTLACIGLQQEVFTDKMPWLQQHLTRKEVAALEPDDIKIQGDFGRGLSYMRRFIEILGDALPVYCLDTQGPLDLAHLILGDDIFLAFYDDPPFVHHLMEIALEIGVRAHTWLKEINGEPADAQFHSGLYAENMGIRICEDTSAIIGPDLLEKFAMPYTRRLAQRFGGAWIHYCGRNDHLTDAVCRIPEIRAVNFGHIPGHEHLHIVEEDMARFAEHEKVYFGSFPREENESGRDYLRRIHRWASQGLMMPLGDEAVAPVRSNGDGAGKGSGGNDGSNGGAGKKAAAAGVSKTAVKTEDEDLFPDVQSALDFWYGLG